LALGLDAVELDDQEEGVWRKYRHRLHPKARARFGNIADDAGERRAAIIERNDASFEDALAGPSAFVILRIAHACAIVNCCGRAELLEWQHYMELTALFGGTPQQNLRPSFRFRPAAGVPQRRNP
jgi:hypothetical protein